MTSRNLYLLAFASMVTGLWVIQDHGAAHQFVGGFLIGSAVRMAYESGKCA